MNMNSNYSKKLQNITIYSNQQCMQIKQHSQHQHQIIFDVFDNYDSSSTASIFDSIPQIIQSMHKLDYKKQRSLLYCKSAKTKYFNKYNNNRILDVQPNISIITQQQSTKTIRYTKQGIARKLVTNSRNLISKISDLSINNLTQQKKQVKIQKVQIFENSNNLTFTHLPKQSDSELSDKLLLQTQFTSQPINKSNRYFSKYAYPDDSQSQIDYLQRQFNIKCFRCGVYGHTARICSQKQKIKCLFCLGQHRNCDCIDILCKRCNQSVHINMQCPCPKVQCYRCHKFGHISRKCGKIMKISKDNKLSDKNIRQDLEKVKCLKCNQLGHYNCHVYQNKIPHIYPASSSQQIQQKKKDN